MLVKVTTLRYLSNVRNNIQENVRFELGSTFATPDVLKRIELEDRHQNPDGNPFPHAVLTKDLIDEDGSATLAARDEVFSFLKSRLMT